MFVLKKLYLLLRVSNWSKAVFVLLGVVYSRSWSHWPEALLAALAFSLIASAVYIYNDLQDIQEDKAHPIKSQRPLASGLASPSFAQRTLMVLLLSSLLLGYSLSGELALILSTYLIINLLYNNGLRSILLLDVLCIASGFMLRILAGTLGIGLPMTFWLTLTATLLSLFIALCKRRLEMQLNPKQTRRLVLKKYNRRSLDHLILGTGVACFFAYAFYTLYVQEAQLFFLLTLPFCAISLWRFGYISTRDHGDDNPISVFFSDKVSVINLFCFVILTFMALLK